MCGKIYTFPSYIFIFLGTDSHWSVLLHLCWIWTVSNTEFRLSNRWLYCWSNWVPIVIDSYTLRTDCDKISLISVYFKILMYSCLYINKTQKYNSRQWGSWKICNYAVFSSIIASRCNYAMTANIFDCHLITCIHFQWNFIDLINDAIMKNMFG